MRRIDLMSSDNKCNPFLLYLPQMERNGKCSMNLKTFDLHMHFPYLHYVNAAAKYMVNKEVSFHSVWSFPLCKHCSKKNTNRKSVASPPRACCRSPCQPVSWPNLQSAPPAPQLWPLSCKRKTQWLHTMKGGCRQPSVKKLKTSNLFDSPLSHWRFLRTASAELSVIWRWK